MVRDNAYSNSDDSWIPPSDDGSDVYSVGEVQEETDADVSLPSMSASSP